MDVTRLGLLFSAVAGLLLADVPVCRDTGVDCETWALEGLCDRAEFAEYLRENCPHSCNSCPPEPVVDPCAGVSCPEVQCGPHQIQSQNETVCCPECVSFPVHGCAPVLRSQMKTGIKIKGANCATLLPMAISSCWGSCASASVAQSPTQVSSECSCCEPDGFRPVYVDAECTRPGVAGSFREKLLYQVVTSCACVSAQCAKPARTDLGHTETALIQELGQFTQNINDANNFL